MGAQAAGLAEIVGVEQPVGSASKELAGMGVTGWFPGECYGLDELFS